MAMCDPKLLEKYTTVSLKGITQEFIKLKDKLSWTDNETILDVGCGTGYVTTKAFEEFVPSNSTITAIDISEEMIDYAKKRYSSNSKIVYKVQDILDENIWTNWEKEQFTKVFSSYMMQRIRDDRKVYSNMFNLLRPGGEIFLLFSIGHKLDEISPYLAEIPKYDAYKEEVRKMKINISPQKDHVSYTKELLKSIGFEIIICKETIVEHDLNSIHDLAELYSLVTCIIELLPKHLFEQVLEDAKSIIIDNQILDETKDVWTVNLNSLVVIAKKPS